MYHFIRIGFVFFVALVLTACASTHMKALPDNERVTRPAPGKALVVFLRASSYAGAVQSAIYDGDSYLGTLSVGTQFAYQAAPGQHLFMVVAESADFLRAELHEGKTYYAILAPRPGFVSARFSFRPQNGQIPDSDMQQWVRETQQVVVGEEGLAWARDNTASVQAKKAEYLSKWRSKPEAEKQTLHASSGR